MTNLYFDYAAATPISDNVLKAMQPYFQSQFYNPSAQYLASQDIKKAIDDARASVAKVIGSKPTEVIFTAGGTESNNLAVRGVMEKFPDSNCVVSSIEHDSVLEPAERFNHKIIKVDQKGLVVAKNLDDLIDDNTALVSIMYANNEIGTIQPIAKTADIIKNIRSKRQKAGNHLPLYLHTDACQAANYLKLLVNSLGVDLMTLNGGKIYGPKQSGVLFVKTGTELHPQIIGGGQERGMRSGTENVPSIIGFAAALTEAQSLRDAEAKRLSGLRDNMIKLLEPEVPGVTINGSLEARLANNVHITVPNQDNELLMMKLDEHGIMAAAGSACSASSDEPSHVLGAIRLTDQDARSSLRITLGRQTDESSVRTFVKTLSTIVAAKP